MIDPHTSQNPNDDGEISRVRQGQVVIIRKRKLTSVTRRFRLPAVILIIIAGLLYGAKAASPRIRRLRAHFAGISILRLIDANKLDEAQKKLPTALLMAPDDPAVLRAAARYCSLRESGNALPFWEKLLATDKATVDDKIGFADSALDAGRTDLTAPIVSDLVQRYPNRLDVLHLGIHHLETAGYADRAITLARGALKLVPFNPKTELMLGSLLLNQPDPTVAEEGRQLLLTVIGQNVAEREAAVAALTDSPKLSKQDAADLLKIVEPLGTSNVTNRIRAMDLRWQADEASHPRVIQDAVRWLSTETNLASFSLGASWAIRVDPEIIRKAVTDTRVATNGLALVHLGEALAKLRRWSELRTLVDKYERQFDPYALGMLRAREAIASGQLNAAENYFLTAGLGARGEGRKLIVAAQEAEAAGFTETAIKIWEALFDIPTERVAATTQIMRLCRDRDDLTSEQKILQRLSSAVPSDSRLAAESAERNILMNIDVQSSAAALDRQAKTDPGEVRWRLDAALADLRSKNDSAAMARLEQTDIDFDKLDDRGKAIYIAVIGANHQRDLARRLTRRVENSKLKRQERDLIQPYL